ncbi:MAG: carboxylesterase/lipase family protein [Gammaproteobacteria bacterium]
MASGVRGATGVLGALAIFFFADGPVRADAPGHPQVRVGEQVLVGQDGSTYSHVAGFYGIPFAEPPVGALRWRAPQPPRVHPDRREATAFAAACYQDSYNTDWYRKVGAAFEADPALLRDPQFSEDCLYLNVWTPKPGADSRLPVMVWIHGGANRAGWSFEPNCLGEHLAARGNVVVVSIAYRHGVFGFFGHPELRGQSNPTNFGLLDQIAALRWVRDHIASFGGDAGNVTIFGESAGAANIGYLMTSPLAQGLFRRAVSQSGGYQILERRTLDDVENSGAALGAALPGRPNLAGLRQLDSATILAAANAALKDHDWGPAEDGTAVLAPITAQNPLRNAPVDLLVDTNQDEWYMYVDEDAAALAAELHDLPGAARPALERLAAAEPTLRRGHDRAVTFANMVCPGYLMAGAVRRAGGQAWVYRFTRVRPGPGGKRLRAYHGAEIPYVFDTHDAWLATDGVDRRLTAAVMQYWVNFARSGDPNGAGLPEWPSYSESGARIVELGDRIGPRPAPDHDLCLLQANALYGVRP